MNNKCSNLDEMQEQKLLSIEHNGFWLAFWGLLAALAVQMIIGGENVVYNLAGEWIVFMCLCVYMVGACIKNGIWDRKLKPNLKTNIIVSVIAGVVSGVLSFAISYRNYGDLVSAIWTGAFVFVFTFALGLAALAVSTSLYKKKVKALEAKAEKESDLDQ